MEIQSRVKISNEKLSIKIQVELSEMKKMLKLKTLLCGLNGLNMAENGISELEYVSELAPCTTLREGKWKMRLRENGGLNENV